MGAPVDRKKDQEDQDKDREAYRDKAKSSRSGARTRWVTERIASLRKNRRHRSGINRRNERFEWCVRNESQAAASARLIVPKSVLAPNHQTRYHQQSKP